MDKDNLQIIKNNLKQRLSRETYCGNAFHLAKEHLLGSFLCSSINNELTVGMITELEVYVGSHDKASHAYPNKRTPRTVTIFGAGGHAYVTLIYGMYSQFNIVAEPEGTATAILIRSIEPVVGIDTMIQRRKSSNVANLTTGPGKLCQAMGISYKMHNGIDLIGNEVWVSPKLSDYEYVESKRIGIDYAEEYRDKLWRFYLKDNSFISKK